MKLKVLAVMATLLAGLMAGKVMADVVLVSTSAATAISSGSTGRKHLIIQNADNIKCYYAKTSSSATVATGNVLNTLGTTGDIITLLDYSGPVYAIGEASSTHAGVSIRTFSVAR